MVARAPGVDPALAFNKAASFVTNTNWQAYSGEATMGHLTQMAGLAVQNFASAAVGIAVVGYQITHVLGAANCRFVAGPIHSSRIALLDHDGVVTRGDHTVGVENVGLPHDEYVALLVRRGPRVLGHFLATATANVTYPSKERRQVAVLLADQVAAALDAE